MSKPMKQTNCTVFDDIKDGGCNKELSAQLYLSQQRQRAALTRLPAFEDLTQQRLDVLETKAKRLTKLYWIVLVQAVFMGVFICLL